MEKPCGEATDLTRVDGVDAKWAGTWSWPVLEMSQCWCAASRVHLTLRFVGSRHTVKEQEEKIRSRSLKGKMLIPSVNGRSNWQMERT
jgi:hypothetical protein